MAHEQPPILDEVPTPAGTFEQEPLAPRLDAADAAVPASGLRHYLLVRHRHNWVQLAKFAAVGGSGTVVNLLVFWVVLRVAGVHHDWLGATVAFVVANTSNYALNRAWTFSGHPSTASAGSAAPVQYGRFLAVGLLGLAANFLVLLVLVHGAGLDTEAEKLLAQLVAIVLVTPISFVGNKLWTFRARHQPG